MPGRDFQDALYLSRAGAVTGPTADKRIFRGTVVKIIRDNQRKFKLAAAALIGLLSCLPLSASWAAGDKVNFPQPGKDAAHTGNNDAETAITAANVASLKQRWMFSTGG